MPSKLSEVDVGVQQVFDSYPSQARKTALSLRQLIFQVAEEEGLGPVQETLKWGEPAYLSKQGSTIRIAWKSNLPDKICVFLNCNSSLVETYRELYSHDLEFQGNRAIILSISGLDREIMSHCFFLALNYHILKHLPLLGA